MARSGMGIDPDFPSGPEGSTKFSVEALDNNDFEGSVDCENGVVGEVSAAAAAVSSVPAAKEVASVGRELAFEDCWGIECFADEMLI